MMSLQCLPQYASPPHRLVGQPLRFGPGRTASNGSWGHQLPILFKENRLMGKRLYVGNLSYDVDSSELEQIFGQFGQVSSAQVISDRDTGRSKGFGFVEMSDDAA